MDTIHSGILSIRNRKVHTTQAAPESALEVILEYELKAGTLMNTKIGGQWMFIHLKYATVGFDFDPSPNLRIALFGPISLTDLHCCTISQVTVVHLSQPDLLLAAMRSRDLLHCDANLLG